MHLGQVPSDVERKFPSLHLIGVDVAIDPHGWLVGILACSKVGDGQGQDVSSLHRLSNRLDFGNFGMCYRDFLHQIPKPFCAVIAVPSNLHFGLVRRADSPEIIFLLCT